MDDLIVGNAGLGAHDGRLHDSLAVDHAAQATRPGDVDDGVDHAATIERRDIAALNRSVIRHYDGDRCIELAKTTQHPVQPLFFVVAFNAHGTEQLLGDANLSLAVRACVIGAGAKLA